jgi:hypothetical protein
MTACTHADAPAGLAWRGVVIWISNGAREFVTARPGNSPRA